MTPIVDASGVTLALAAPPRRIVSLIPSTTELLCALGLADRLVGVSAYCVEPRAVMRAMPKVGGEKDPDVPAIVGLAPDLVVANLEENVRRDVEALRAAGLTVWVTFPRTVDDAVALVREVGVVTGTEARATAMADELAALVARTRAATARRRAVAVFYPIWRDPYMTIGRDTYVHDVLRTVGAANVFGDRDRYPVVTLDEVAVRRPEVIVLPDEPFRFRRAHVKDFERYSDARIHLVDGKLFCWHGPRLAEALRVLPALFSGSAAAGSG